MFENVACGLCDGRNVKFYHRATQGAVKGRCYLQCQHCDLIFAPPSEWLTAKEEKAFYSTHHNDPADAGYRHFLSRVVTPLTWLLPPACKGLDFGSGPGPALATMLEDKGFHCANYDLYYANHAERLTDRYTFITATEVFEHLGQPGAVLDTLVHCLRPGGWLALLTQRPISHTRFTTWRYTHDPTHISFFSIATLDFICRRWSLRQVYLSKDVVILRKPTAAKHLL